jgi:hypothetical protein
MVKVHGWPTLGRVVVVVVEAALVELAWQTYLMPRPIPVLPLTVTSVQVRPDRHPTERVQVAPAPGKVEAEVGATPDVGA